MEKKPINCCRDWGKVRAGNTHCRVINGNDCLDMECTWNLERNPGKCLYEGRSVKVNSNLLGEGYRIYLPSGPVEGRTELEAIAYACIDCDIRKVCYLLPNVSILHT